MEVELSISSADCYLIQNINMIDDRFCELISQCSILSALFLLDTGSKMWLWQGWWPETDCRSNADNFSENNATTASNLTGSAMIRWHAERRAAMQVGIQRCSDAVRIRSRAVHIPQKHLFDT